MKIGEMEMTDSDLPKLPIYQCHKKVSAAEIGAIVPIDMGYFIMDLKIPIGFSMTVFGFPSTKVNKAYMDKHQPKVGDYYVRYEDGYESCSPAEAFESGYTLLVDESIDK